MTLYKGFILGPCMEEIKLKKMKKWYFSIFNYLEILTSFANGSSMSTRYCAFYSFAILRLKAYPFHDVIIFYWNRTRSIHKNIFYVVF